MSAAVQHTIVATSDRPALAAITARWRWDAFVQGSGRVFEDVLAAEHKTAVEAPAMPKTLVLLADGNPVGMASLIAHDLDERPDLTPWLAGVYVVPNARRQGHAGRLVAAIEQEAMAASISTLWLYTRNAERIYARSGWRTVEVFQRKGRDYALMRRDLPG